MVDSNHQSAAQSDVQPQNMTILRLDYPGGTDPLHESQSANKRVDKIVEKLFF